MAAEVTVRDATPDDARGIAHVHTRTWQVAYTHIFPAQQLERLSEERRADWWGSTLDSPPARSHAFVATDASRVIGFASVGVGRDEPEHVGELYAIYVLPEAWGRGVGQALMRGALERLTSAGFAEAILWVLEDNPRTRRFYELAGWHADGGVQEDELLETAVRDIRYRIAI